MNVGPICPLGQARSDLVEIIVALFDLEGFTNFFNRASVPRYTIIPNFINAFLSWLNHSFSNPALPKPDYSKFLGDGVLLVWETDKQRLLRGVLKAEFMNFCWRLVRGQEKSYEKEFLPELLRKISPIRTCEYPKHLRVCVSLGHAVKYVRGKSVEYVSECINVASRIIRYNPELYFIAHSNLVTNEAVVGKKYVHKQLTEVRGIDNPICVYIDEADFKSLTNKSKRKFRKVRGVTS
jgi:hypothetical protein